jgi:hypothetical protein
LVPDTKIDTDGFVIDGEERFRLYALRQIAVRQDTYMTSLTGPIIGFIDVAVVQQSTCENRTEIQWAAAVFVRPTITHIGSFLREIERCRQGHIKDNRASVVSGYRDHVLSPQDLHVIIVTKGVEHREIITSQGFIFLSCPEAFTKPSTPNSSQSEAPPKV